MNKKTILSLCTLSLILTGCLQEKEIDWQERLANSVDPVNSLQADAISSTYTREYWAQQKRSKSEPWRYAVAFCVTHDEYPNCNTIIALMK